MAEDKKVVKADIKPEAVKPEPVQLSPRIHINEFLRAHSDLNFLQQAGFRAVVKKEWMRLEEWKEQLAKHFDKK